PTPAAATAAAGGAPSTDGGEGVECPHCGTSNVAGALFCEACGYDFTTGAMPRGSAPASPDAGAGAAPDAGGATSSDGSSAGADAAAAAAAAADPGPIAPAVPLEWVAEVWVDPDWYAAQDQVDQPCPSPGLPTTVPLTVRSLLVGRVSRSRNIHPEIDCGTDAAVSRRQAQLTTDGSRWFVEDLQSSNGTFVGPASGPLPTVPLVPGQRQELAEDDRVYVGAWTRLVVRRATEEERAAG
ncbi:FHA domain-containing protein, partial [Actinotalea ferrariae]|uniref:FHA domain-containing protein n=1 Tax=Actinotalea ferrariae TaxID=1386098 RepID=UPI001C8C72A2